MHSQLIFLRDFIGRVQTTGTLDFQMYAKKDVFVLHYLKKRSHGVFISKVQFYPLDIVSTVDCGVRLKMHCGNFDVLEVSYWNSPAGNYKL